MSDQASEATVPPLDDVPSPSHKQPDSTCDVATSVADWSRRVVGEVNKVFVGQNELVRGVITALLAEGHVLIESVPGLGKTLLVRASAGSSAAPSIESSSRLT